MNTLTLKRVKTIVSLLFTGLSIMVFTSTAKACTVPPTPSEPPPHIWIENHGDTSWVGVEVKGLFSIAAKTTCACGLSTVNALPLGISVTGAALGVTNKATHETEFVEAFGFSSNETTTSGLEGEFGSNWTGFSAEVNPFTPPTVGADDVLKLWFEVKNLNSVDLATVFNSASTSFATGEASSDGSPIFDGDHPVEQFSAVPIPSAAWLFGVGFISIIGNSVKKRNKS